MGRKEGVDSRGDADADADADAKDERLRRFWLEWAVAARGANFRK